MNDKLKEAFDHVRAEETLKANTRAFLARKTRDYTSTKVRAYHTFAYVAVCLLFLILGGHWLYLVPTVEISIDINPSIELGINRLDQVVSINSYNDAGEQLADTLTVQFLNYAEAVGQILENENIEALLSSNAVMSIAVIGPDGTQSDRIFSELEACTAEQDNTHCYSLRPEEVAAAHEVGLSYGKYRAFLELQAIDPDITPAEIQNMSMREIRDLISSLSTEESARPQTDSSGNPAQNGAGKGHGQKNRHKQQ